MHRDRIAPWLTAQLPPLPGVWVSTRREGGGAHGGPYVVLEVQRDRWQKSVRPGIGEVWHFVLNRRYLCYVSDLISVGFLWFWFCFNLHVL